MFRVNWTRGFAATVMAAALVMPALVAASGSTIADAAMRGDSDGVRALLKQAADVNAAQGDGMTALHWAAMKNDAELAQTLLFAGANIKAATRIGAYTPIVLAAREINAKEPVRGLTAVMFAAASDRAPVIELLARRGADIKATTSTIDLNSAGR